MTSRKAPRLPALEVVGERSARLGVGRARRLTRHPVPHDANEVVGNEPEDGERLSTQAVLTQAGVLVPLRVEGQKQSFSIPQWARMAAMHCAGVSLFMGRLVMKSRSSITGGFPALTIVVR